MQRLCTFLKFTINTAIIFIDRITIAQLQIIHHRLVFRKQADGKRGLQFLIKLIEFCLVLNRYGAIGYFTPVAYYRL